MAKRRKFTTAEKISIIKEATIKGISRTLSKYDVYPATYYSWKKELEHMGEEGFHHEITTKQLRQIRKLENENKSLKEMVAEKELVIRALKEKRGMS